MLRTAGTPELSVSVSVSVHSSPHLPPLPAAALDSLQRDVAAAVELWTAEQLGSAQPVVLPLRAPARAARPRRRFALPHPEMLMREVLVSFAAIAAFMLLLGVSTWLAWVP